ncbi:MAG: hypothetical protein LBH17_04515, partial [Oscillospiraceae bacterium]|nr:hypothetical protein [Oscillospiraceae bacterium]
EAGDAVSAAGYIRNAFEDALPIRRRAEINQIKSALISHGALAASMTGTGSAVFALYDSKAAAQGARDAISREYNKCFATELTRGTPISTDETA